MNIQFKARGLCVRDLKQTVRFYEAALDFAPQLSRRMLDLACLPGSGELRNAQGHLQSIRDPQGVDLTLVEFNNPHSSGTLERRPNNQYGLTHLAFWVADIERSAERIDAAGGKPHPHTRAFFPEAQVTMMYATDPNGVRIELMQRPEQNNGFSHSGICTSAIEPSLNFYSELNFAEAERFDLQSKWLDTINELDDVRLSAQMIRNLRGDTLELLQIDHPPCFGALERAPLDSYGFNFLILTATDLTRAADAIKARGGMVHFRAQDHRSLCGLSCSDPNGVRLEILRRTP
ncbi:VOC family protein [Pseudomonas sp. CT11-2]|uniref:VOC family protein n=1 Tax=Pseudomonas sp. CT11-2 TaxID=3243023 RepID=UPI0039B0EC61